MSINPVKVRGLNELAEAESAPVYRYIFAILENLWDYL